MYMYIHVYMYMYISAICFIDGTLCVFRQPVLSECLFFPTAIFGEDVGFGGVFRCTANLRDKYGEEILDCNHCKHVNVHVCFMELRSITNPRHACAGGLRYLSCLSVFRSVCYHSSGDLVCFNARSRVHGVLLFYFVDFR